MRAITSATGRAGQALIVIGALLMVGSTLLPVLKTPAPVDLSRNALILHREGLILVAIAAVTFLLLDLFASGRLPRVLSALSLVVLGLSASAYASSVNENDVVDRFAFAWSSRFGVPERILAEIEPGIALGVTATGGTFVALGGLFLLAGAARRSAVPRPDRTHPVWM